MTTSRWRILQPDNRSPYLSPHTTSPCVHTSFSLSCKSAAHEAVCPFTTCSSASRLWSSSGASKIHTLSFLPGISVPWPRHSSSYIFSSIWHLCNFSISIFKGKKKMKPFWQHNTLTPPSSPAPNHSTETPLCCKCNSCFSCLPPRPNCQYSLSTFLIRFYCAPLLPAYFYILAIYIFSLSSAFKCIKEYVLHHPHLSTYVGY